MEISIKRDGEVQIVACAGRLTMTTARSLRDAVDRALSGGPARLVIDLAEVAFIDSSGLGALISGLKRSRQAGGDLRIARPVEQVRLVLKLTNLDKVLRAYPTAEDARVDW